MERSGSIPNIFRHHVSNDELRLHERFWGLPPVDQLNIQTPFDYRFVRQDSELWETAHKGALTTGRLAAALGFFEPQAAKRLGLPKSRVDHARLVEAADHMREPPFIHVNDRAVQMAQTALMTNQLKQFRWNGSKGESDQDANILPSVSTILRTSRSAAQNGILTVGSEYGKLQENGALAQLLDILPTCILSEAGLFFGSFRHTADATEYPILGASPDAVVWHPKDSEFCPSLKQTHLIPCPTGGSETLGVAEVVEVKNLCPYVMDASVRYSVVDRGPIWEVRPEHVPQLQLQMLTTGLQSALLVCRSATRGLRVFRMYKDENYCKLLFKFVGRFWTEIVRAGKGKVPVSRNPWIKDQVYESFLGRTKTLAQTATMVLEAPATDDDADVGASFRRSSVPSYYSEWFLNEEELLKPEKESSARRRKKKPSSRK